MCCGRSRRGSRRIRAVGKRTNSIEQQAIDAKEEDRKARDARKVKELINAQKRLHNPSL